MKKIFTIVAAALLFACAANAQTYFNLGYGYGMNKVQFGELDPDTVGSNAITAGVSHNFGIAGNVSSKVDFHQSGTEKGTRERVRSKVTKFGYHYKFLSSF